MANLKKVFETLEFTDVRTLLNSGNAVFSTQEKDISQLRQEIQDTLEKTFGFSIPVIVRTSDEIKSLVTSDPFKTIIVTPQTRLYVTFLSGESKSSLKIHYESVEKDFRILSVSKDEICSVIIPSPRNGTLDMMSFIEKEFGKNVTTRNWNTVKKISAL